MACAPNGATMRRSAFACGLSGAALIALTGGSFGRAVTADAAEITTKTVEVAPVINGIVIRGTWRAHVALGAPRLTIVANQSVLQAVVVTRRASTLTIAQSGPFSSEQEPVLQVSLARLSGVATSGDVDLAIDDRSDVPLFLDIAGSSTARATGAVPLLRVTTSGSVNANLTGMAAMVARVHARQASRLAIRARDALTIVALDAAHVSYAGTPHVQVTTKNVATVTRL